MGSPKRVERVGNERLGKSRHSRSRSSFNTKVNNVMVTDSRDNYRRSQNEYQRPAGQFTQRDDIREYMGGGAGKNFSAMRDIQQQLPNMQVNDPRVQEFKDRRRHFNRYDKNGYGEVFNKSPLEMQDMYQGMSRDVRQTNKPVYNKMYPITGSFMDYADQGGIYGMAARGIFGGLKKDVTGMGKDILNNVGIGGAVDSDEEELKTFSERTFGPNMADVAGPGSGPIFYDRSEELEDYEDDPNSPRPRQEDTFVEDDFGAFFTDENTLAEPNPMPFDDSNREQGIMDQQYQSPIGPMDDPSRRPDMMDVSGRGINRGLFPYPGYNDPVYLEQFGRGEIPYGFDYNKSNKDRVDNYRLDQMLGRILPEEEEMEEEFQMFGPRGR